MPAHYIQNRATDSNRTLQQRQLAQIGRGVTDNAHRADRSRAVSGEAYSELDRHETWHPEFRNINALRVVSFYIAVAVLVCILTIDIALFGPTAEFIGGLSPKHPELVSAILRILIPVAILGFELYAAMQLYEAGHSQHSEQQARSRRAFWLFVAISFAIVMPVLIIASHPSTATAIRSGRLATLLRFQLIAFVALAFATHAGVLFSGRIGHESKAYFLFNTKRRRLQRQVREADRHFEAAAQAATQEFNEFLLLNDEYVLRFPGERRAHWSFDQITTDLINERFGRTMIQPPTDHPAANGTGARNNDGGSPNNGGPTPAPPPAVPAHATPVEQTAPVTGNDDSETDYLRSIVRGRMREADGEVRP